MTSTLDFLVARSATLAKPCIVRKTITALPDKYGKALNDLLTNPSVEHLFIKRRLTEAGISLGETTIRRHRSGDCCCPKEA